MTIDYEGGRTYFAMEEDTDRLSQRAMLRLRAFRDDYTNSGRLRVILDSHDMYFSRDRNGLGEGPQRVRVGGQRGELASLKSPHFASLTRLIRVITTAQLPDLEPRALNTDEAQESAAILARDLILSYREGGLDEKFVTWAQHATLYGYGFLLSMWDPQAGAERRDLPNRPMLPEDYEQEFNPELGQVMPGQPLRQGDVRTINLTPLDVALDTFRQNANNDWVIITTYVNRWELAQQVHRAGLMDERFAGDAEARAQSIIDFMPKSASGQAGVTWPRLSRRWYGADDLDGATTALIRPDIIPVQELLHRPTPLMPEGRRFRFLSESVPVDWEPLPLGDTELPLYMVCPETEDDTPYGHSPIQDIQGTQEAMDAAMSTAVTRNKASLPMLLAPNESKVEVRRMGRAFAIANYNPVAGARNNGEPTIFAFSNDTTQDLNLFNALESSAEKIVGINAALRGERQSGQSGSSQAFQSQQGILGNKNFEASLYRGMEAVALAHVRLHQRHNVYPRKLSGSADKRMQQLFVGKDLKGVDTVSVKTTGVFRQDPQARMAFLAGIKELDPNAIVPAAKQLLFVQTGRFEEAGPTEGRDELLFIKSENELLRQGKVPLVPSVYETHLAHIQSHKGVIFNLSAKADAAVVQAVYEHIAAHEKEMSKASAVDSGIAGLTGPVTLEDLQPGPRSAGGMPPGEPPPESEEGPPSRPPSSGGQRGQSSAGGPPAARLPSLPNGQSSEALTRGQLPPGAP